MHTPAIRAAFGYFDCAVVVVEGATASARVAASATMLIIGLTLNPFGISLFCGLMFKLAGYALPFVIGLTADMAAFKSGAGVIGALLVGTFVGILEREKLSLREGEQRQSLKSLTPVISRVHFMIAWITLGTPMAWPTESR